MMVEAFIKHRGDEMIRILSSTLTTSRPTFLRPNISPIIDSMNCLLSSVVIEILKVIRPKPKSTKTSLNSLVPTPIEVPVVVSSANKIGSQGRGNTTIGASIGEAGA
jgi:hypothetical protein